MQTTRRFTIMIPIKLYKELVELSGKRYCTVSSLIVAAILSYLERCKNENEKKEE